MSDGLTVSVDSLLNTDGSIKMSTASTTKVIDDDGSTLDKTDFLSLLCTQMQYQDPLDPMDNSQMAAQLAQFSSLEGIQNIETAINNQTEVFSAAVTALQTSALSTTNSSSISLIGKTVKLQQTSLEYTGEEVSFDIHLGNNDSATVKLLDSDGNTVKTFTASDKNDENSVTLTWDGTNDQGKTVDSGTYTIEITGQDSDSSLYCYVEGRVTGVLFTSADGPVVKINGVEMSIGDILEVAET